MKKIIIVCVLVVAILTAWFKINRRAPTQLEIEHLRVLTGFSTVDNRYPENKVGISNVFIKFGDEFPHQTAERAKVNQSLLMITWEPYRKNNNNSMLAEIARGEHDKTIISLAEEIRIYGLPVLLRFGHEMNGNWYPWSGSNNQNNPSFFIDAYRHVYDLILEKKAYNTIMVFSVNNEDIPNSSWNRFEAYFPGKKYVDVIGIDGYNWGAEKKLLGILPLWRTPEEVFKGIYNRIVRSYPDIPIVITEVGSASKGGDKEKWLKDFFDLLEYKLTAVKGFVWFNIDKEADWSLSDKQLMLVYNQKLGGDYFTTDSVVWDWLIQYSNEKKHR